MTEAEYVDDGCRHVSMNLLYCPTHKVCSRGNTPHCTASTSGSSRTALRRQQLSALLAATPEQLAAGQSLPLALGPQSPSSNPRSPGNAAASPATLARLQDGGAALSEDRLVAALCSSVAGKPAWADALCAEKARAEAAPILCACLCTESSLASQGCSCWLDCVHQPQAA